MITHREYLNIFSELVELTQKPKALDEDSPERPRINEIMAIMKEFEDTAPKWEISCIKDGVYVGQGISFEKGDVVHTFFDESEAVEIFEQMNKDAWNPGVWKLEKVR